MVDVKSFLFVDDESGEDDPPLPADFILREDWTPVVKARAGAVSVSHVTSEEKERLRQLVENAIPFSGATLQSMRKTANVSLDQLNLKTKIPLKYLVAIEENRTYDLPAPAYLRGFVFAYLKFLGISEQDVLDFAYDRYTNYLNQHSTKN